LESKNAPRIFIGLSNMEEQVQVIIFLKNNWEDGCTVNRGVL